MLKHGVEFEQAPGDGEGQGSLVCCSPWGHKESDMTEQQQSYEGLKELTSDLSLRNDCIWLAYSKGILKSIYGLKSIMGNA